MPPGSAEPEAPDPSDVSVGAAPSGQTVPGEGPSNDETPSPVQDSDDDGIPDDSDACPDTPAGDDVYDTGCGLSQTDTDGDTLSNAEEIRIGTYLSNADSDADGLDDADELGAGTNPLRADSDFDALSDGDEVNQYGTDPLSRYSDTDGIDDWVEVMLASNPIDPDTDGDGFRDGDEIELRLSLLVTLQPLAGSGNQPCYNREFARSLEAR